MNNDLGSKLPQVFDHDISLKELYNIMIMFFQQLLPVLFSDEVSMAVGNGFVNVLTSVVKSHTKSCDYALFSVSQSVSLNLIDFEANLDISLMNEGYLTKLI